MIDYRELISHILGQDKLDEVRHSFSFFETKLSFEWNLNLIFRNFMNKNDGNDGWKGISVSVYLCS